MMTILAPIAAPDAATSALALGRQNSLTKPAGSLGQLEGLACRFAGRQGRIKPVLLPAAILLHNEMTTFTEAGVSEKAE